jgi:thioredoxin 1
MDSNDDEAFGFENMAGKLGQKLSSDAPDAIANGQLNEIAGEQGLSMLKKPKTTLLLIYRTQCPYCKQLLPRIRELADDYVSTVYFAKVNADENPDIIERFTVLGVPLVIALKKGQEVARIEGLRNIEIYNEWMRQIHRGIRPMDIESGPASEIE